MLLKVESGLFTNHHAQNLATFPNDNFFIIDFVKMEYNMVL